MRTSPKTLLLAGIATLAFLALLGLFRDFVLDDAFITYRYSKQLVEGNGLRWNAGADPVEGYTSFLWVLVNAAGLLAGADPVLWSKILGGLAALAIVGVLVFESGRLHWSLGAALAAGIALNPRFALLSIQGMETPVAALLILLSAKLHLAALSEGGRRALLGLHAVVFLALLARPDTVAFTVPLLAGTGLLVLAGRDRRMTGTFIACAAALGAAVGLYVLWRYLYFGHLFPNTYYVKANLQGGLPAAAGTSYLLGFLGKMALPYLVLGGFFAIRHRCRDTWIRAVPILAGLITFGYYITTIFPKQGLAWRFIFPVFPALLLVVIHLASSRSEAARRRPYDPHPIAATILVLLFAFWPLRGLESARGLAERRSPRDRIAVGRGLADLEGTLVTTESGALPYFSGWESVDLLGLNSEAIAHDGLSVDLLDRVNPDLVMTLCRVHNGICGPPGAHEIVLRYLAERGFVAAVSMVKNRNNHHLYFIRRDSPIFEEIAGRLQGIEEVEYTDVKAIVDDPRIPALSGTRGP